MRIAKQISAKHADSIVTTLSCVDRLIFKGYLPFGGDQQLNQFVDRLGIRRKDFLPKLEHFSERLVKHAKAAAAKANAPYHYLQGRHSKEKLIDQSIRERKLTSGLIAVLCCQEHCRTVKLRYGEGRPRLAFSHRPQRVLYSNWSMTQRYSIPRSQGTSWSSGLTCLAQRLRRLFQARLKKRSA